jgi:(1->4)-alpha-D-glucan 1-alpha-D-glucosylmutase
MMQARAREWPHGMTATATHDTKRGEDARARLMALSEIPGEWTSAVARWKVLNARHLVVDGDLRAPSPATEYMLYQALLGAWPVEGPDASFTERIQAYALKAVREGKEQTSWLNPHQAYETGLNTFIERILDPARSREFIESISVMAGRVALVGALNSLSQLTLKATLPGVPDFYQGTEFWDLSLVDPDNRRPVDFAARAAVLSALSTSDWETLVQSWHNGHIKLAWTVHLLKLRTELAAAFTSGDYQPLEVSGPHRDHVIAFARRKSGDAAIIVTLRHFAVFSDGGRTWPRADAFDATVDLSGYTIDGIRTNDRLPLSSLFTQIPAAVLKAKVAAPARLVRKRIPA